ncbi:vWA domain-containing protein [Enhygromyxa salina]|uniref:von Willebrand factor n=1 Tax=Enhygromyxa salina TaxID=215803 RepID=A0A2S9XQR4_9BACT|nr:VWA domain-containing protein [Enhygromyxa salina]PRP95080.1 von Willebrand factor [Enhygromyxa salina]
MADPNLDSSDVSLTPSPPGWRRPALLISSLSLLALGVVLNGPRLAAEYQGFAAKRAEATAEVEPPPELEPADHLVMVGHVSVHKGEEGKMGAPKSKSSSGLYAMKGPQNVVPQMARNFDPDAAADSAGILGVMESGAGHFLVSPHGGAFAVGDDAEDVWGGLTGTEVGEAYGVGGLGLVGTGGGGGGGGPGYHERDAASERYAALPTNVFVLTANEAKSTFSIDVDTASYANTRRYLLDSAQLPPPAAVRTEELINYFDYDYPMPSGDGAPFSVTTEVGPSPWSPTHRLIHVGIQGHVPAVEQVPARNLVFLIDVSGSMQDDDKLPLIKHGLASLTETLGPDDRVSIVVYAGAAGAVLPPTSGADNTTILAALDRLTSGGGTNGAEGIELAYQLAEQTFIAGGINRVILASDGDFNVGLSDHDELVRLVERKRESGVFLSVLGVGTGNFNDHMMEQIADKGNGNYAYIDGMAEARKVLVDESAALLHTIAKDVKIQVEFDPEQIAEHRLVGYENRVLAHRDFDDDSKDAGEIGAGHTVTAIYEVVPTPDHDSGPLMTLNLRYKQPDEDHSRKLTTQVSDAGLGMAQTSTDYRFSAAVAAFAEALRGTPSEASYVDILRLAQGSLGADAHCYRHQFLDMVWQAGVLAGEQLDKPDSSCEPQPEPTRYGPTTIVHELEPTDTSEAAWMSFTLEVLRLLPPLLALPLFVMALRRPRRRRE